MKRTFSLVALGAALVGAAGAQAQPFPTTPPTLGAAPTVRPPTPEVRTLANGMKVMYVRMPEVPVVSANLVIRGAGTTEDPADLPGLASFTATMLDEGAAGKSALQIADALETLGASLGTNAGWDAAQANLYVLKKNFPEALRIMADVAVRPDFPANEVQRLRTSRYTHPARESPARNRRHASGLVFARRTRTGACHVQATQALDRAKGGRSPRRVRPRSHPGRWGGIPRCTPWWRRRRRCGRGAAPARAGSLYAPHIARTRVLVDKPGRHSRSRIGHPACRATRGLSRCRCQNHPVRLRSPAAELQTCAR